jgi:hypothetical protein
VSCSVTLLAAICMSVLLFSGCATSSSKTQTLRLLSAREWRLEFAIHDYVNKNSPQETSIPHSFRSEFFKIDESGHETPLQNLYTIVSGEKVWSCSLDEVKIHKVKSSYYSFRITRPDMKCIFYWCLLNGKLAPYSIPLIIPYRPHIPPATSAGITISSRDLGTETKGGHVCRKIELTASDNEGIAITETRWKAEDVKEIPFFVQVEYSINNVPYRNRYSELRVSAIDDSVFEPPRDVEFVEIDKAGKRKPVTFVGIINALVSNPGIWMNVNSIGYQINGAAPGTLPGFNPEQLKRFPSLGQPVQSIASPSQGEQPVIANPNGLERFPALSNPTP